MKKTANVQSVPAPQPKKSAWKALCTIVLSWALIAPAHAQGFDKVTTAVDNVKAILTAVSLSVVTIAIIWAGFLLLSGKGEMGKLITIIAGGLLIGGAAQLAAYFIT